MIQFCNVKQFIFDLEQKNAEQHRRKRKMTSSSSTSSNHTYIDMMQEMGFDREVARQALIATNFKSIDSAIEHILNVKLTAPTSTSSSKQQKKQRRTTSKDDKEVVDFSKLEYSKSVALLIGVEDYKLMQPLSGASDSINYLGNVLENAFGFEVRKLLNENVTNTSIMELICSLKDLEPNSRVLIAFVGHARMEQTRKSNQEYFCCCQFDPNDDSPLNKLKNAYYYRELYRTVEEYCYAKHVVLLLDCLFSEKLSQKHQKYNLSKASHESCLFAISSGDVDSQRTVVSSLLYDTCKILTQPAAKLDNNNGYTGISDIAASVAKINQQGEVRYGHLNETKGQALFKLQTQVVLTDKNTKDKIYLMKDNVAWQDMNEYWDDGLYLCSWNNGIAVSPVDVGWFSVPADRSHGLHSCVVHKSGTKVIVYEYGMYDHKNHCPLKENTRSLDSLALGSAGCFVATEWKLTGPRFSQAVNLFNIPSACDGHMTDLAQHDTNRKWARFTDNTATHSDPQQLLEKVSDFVQRSSDEEKCTNDRQWKGVEIYTLQSNNSHCFSHSLLCHLLENDKIDWVLNCYN